MPTNHSRGFHNGDGRLPLPPNRRQPRPEQPIRSCQLRSLHRPLQNSELMTKGQNLKLKGRTTAKESQEGRPQRYKWRRISKSKVVRQTSIYQQLRDLREPQWPTGQRSGALKGVGPAASNDSPASLCLPDRHRAGPKVMAAPAESSHTFGRAGAPGGDKVEPLHGTR